MSFILFTELVVRLLEKLNKMSLRRRGEDRGDGGSNIDNVYAKPPLVYDSRHAYVDVRVMRDGSVSIVDDLLYVDVPLIDVPTGLLPRIGEERERRSRQPTSIVLSSRELVTRGVAEVLKKYFGIEIEPDVDVGGSGEREKESGGR